MINKGLFTSNSDEWETPQELFDELNREFNFDLDPCATEKNTKCELYYTKKEDGLREDGLIRGWDYYYLKDGKPARKISSVFMNPPYGRKIGRWVQKAYEESQHGITVVCLLPARTDTRWFHAYCLEGEIRWIKGRLKFSGMKNSAPFPSMIVIFRGVA